MHCRLPGQTLLPVDLEQWLCWASHPPPPPTPTPTPTPHSHPHPHSHPTQPHSHPHSHPHPTPNPHHPPTHQYSRVDICCHSVLQSQVFFSCLSMPKPILVVENMYITIRTPLIFWSWLQVMRKWLVSSTPFWYGGHKVFAPNFVLRS